MQREITWREKMSFPGAIRAEAVLEILGCRGWENPAGYSKRRTGWAPSPESLRFLSRRPAEGELIFSLHSNVRQTWEILYRKRK